MAKKITLLAVLALIGCDRTCQACVDFCKPFAVASCQPGFDGLSPVACKCSDPSTATANRPLVCTGKGLLIEGEARGTVEDIKACDRVYGRAPKGGDRG